MKSRELSRWILAIMTVCSAGIVAHAQNQLSPEDLEPKSLPANPPRVAMPDDARMQTILYEVEQYAGDRLPFELLEVLPEGATLRDVMPEQFSAVQSELARRDITLRDDGRVNVEITGPEGGDPVDEALLNAVDAHLFGTWRQYADAWVPVDQLTNLAQSLPDAYFMKRAHPICYDLAGGEGTQTINSSTYISMGGNGAGRTIAVLDSGYNGFTESRAEGDAPPQGQTTTINYSGGSFEGGSSQHGTGCVEATFDHAPQADYRLYKLSNVVQVGMAVDDAIQNGAHIITHSLSWYNQGWDDNTGAACAAANAAADAGLLFFTSAGNRARQHWQGTMNPSAGNWHRFSGNDETIAITVPDNGGGSFALQWDASTGLYDYDLYLYDSDLTTVLASSTSIFPNVYEEFSWTNDSGSTRTVHLAVFRNAGGNTEFELFMHGTGGTGNFQHFVSPGSITSPSNSTRPNVISNAAVDWSDHDSDNGTTGIIMNYSSQGPSNSGAVRPDLAGPTNTGTVCCGGTFGGTSCATPNNAGAAAAFWSEYPQFSAMAIRWLLFEQAARWKDWGVQGKDNVYGHGGSFLIDYANERTWVARDYGNVSDSHQGPYYTIQTAFNHTSNFGRVTIFLGGEFPEPFTSFGSSWMTIETVGDMATLGSQ